MTVMVTYPHANQVAHNFSWSLLNLDKSVVSGVIPTRGYPGTGLIRARNAAVDLFLRSDDDWLLTLDTDIGFPPDLIDRMLCHQPYAVISGFYSTILETADILPDGSTTHREYPLAVREVETDGILGFKPYDTYSGAMEVDAVGAGCLLVHHSAFEAVGRDWYNSISGLGEDFSFCMKVRHAGFKILCDTTIPLSHYKSVWLRG